MKVNVQVPLGFADLKYFGGYCSKWKVELDLYNTFRFFSGFFFNLSYQFPYWLHQFALLSVFSLFPSTVCKGSSHVPPPNTHQWKGKSREGNGGVKRIYSWIKNITVNGKQNPQTKAPHTYTCCHAGYSSQDCCWGLGCKSSLKQRVLAQTIGLIPGPAELHLSPLCVHPQRKKACGTSVGFPAQWQNPCFDWCLARSKCSEIIFCYR